jgi:hypothetical protein
MYDPFISPAKRDAIYRKDMFVNENPSKGDVWSLGMVFVLMLHLDGPDDLNKPGREKKVAWFIRQSGRYNYPDSVRFILYNMLQHNERKRWSFA